MILHLHYDNSDFYSWRGQGGDAKTRHDDHEREGERARPQPASARQEGGEVSQKPPWGLALMLRGSMSAVPSSAGMRASMHSGTGPHSCRLFCVANPRFEGGQTHRHCMKRSTAQLALRQSFAQLQVVRCSQACLPCLRSRRRCMDMRVVKCVHGTWSGSGFWEAASVCAVTLSY